MAIERNTRDLSNPEELIYLVSALLGTTITQCANEREAPMRSADASDDFIKEMKTKVVNLRRIRQELEAIIYGDPGV